jgi:hypothetical protein
VNDQISQTLENIQKIIDSNIAIDANPDNEGFFEKDVGRMERGKSLKMDTTMMSDIDYLNILPDMEDRMDIEECSFLKLNNSQGNKLDTS